MVAALLGACSGDDDGGDPQAVGAATYAAVISEFLPPSDAEPDDDDRPVVYVAPLNDPLSLEDQVAVIDAVAETFDLRFVDDLSAAFEIEEDGDGDARDDAVVLAIGRIPAESPHTVRVEVYPDADRITAELVTVVVAGTDADGAVVWRVDHVEQVEPEGLVGDE